jgi:hypothetical protein
MASSAPGWYAVAGALGGATLASVANQLIARRQRKVDGERLDRQLAHDREMRDREHVRAVLGPIADRLTKVDDPVAALKGDLDEAEGVEQGADRKRIVLPLVLATHERERDVHSDAITLMLVLGEGALAAQELGTIGTRLGEAGKAARRWLNGSLDRVSLDDALSKIEADCEAAALRFMTEAQRLAGVAEGAFGADGT